MGRGLCYNALTQIQATGIQTEISGWGDGVGWPLQEDGVSRRIPISSEFYVINTSNGSGNSKAPGKI